MDTTISMYAVLPADDNVARSKWAQLKIAEATKLLIDGMGTSTPDMFAYANEYHEGGREAFQRNKRRNKDT